MEAAILDKTIEALAQGGLDGLRVDRVAAAAELNKTSVYRRYPTREALVVAALERVLDELELSAVDTGALETDLVELYTAVARFLASDGGRALAGAVIGGVSQDAIRAHAARMLTQKSAGAAADLVARAVERGEWDPARDPVTAFGALTGALLHRVHVEGAAVDEGYVRGLVAIVANGLRSRP